MSSIETANESVEDQDIKKSFHQFLQQQNSMAKQNQHIGGGMQQQRGGRSNSTGMFNHPGVAGSMNGGGNFGGLGSPMSARTSPSKSSFHSSMGSSATASIRDSLQSSGVLSNLGGSTTSTDRATAMLANRLQLENLCTSPEDFRKLVNLDMMQHAGGLSAGGLASTGLSMHALNLKRASLDLQSQRSSNSSAQKDNNGLLARPVASAKDVAHRNSSQLSVNHDYTDYSNVPEEDQELPPEVDDNNNVRKRNTGGVVSPFPERLHDMLSKTNAPEVVGWAPHGRCFLVRKPKEFENKIMPLYFNHTKLTSFQRQLNLYGFKRITKGVDRGAYYHELFLRYRPKLCTRMRRQKVKGTGQKPLPDPDNEPNFYAMKSVEPLPHRNGNSDDMFNNSLEGDDLFATSGSSTTLVSDLKPSEPLPASLFDSPRASQRTGSTVFSNSMPPLNLGNAPDMPEISRSISLSRHPDTTAPGFLPTSGIKPDPHPDKFEGPNDGASSADVKTSPISTENVLSTSIHTPPTSTSNGGALVKPNIILSGQNMSELATATTTNSDFDKPAKKEKKGFRSTMKKTFSKLTGGSSKEKSKNDSGEPVGKVKIAVPNDALPQAQANGGNSPGGGPGGATTAAARSGRPRRSSLIDKSAPRERRESVKFHPEEVWFGTRNERRKSIQELANQSETRGAVRRLSQNRLSITSIGSLSHGMSISVSKDKSMSGREKRMSLMSFESFNIDDDADALQKRMSMVSIGSALVDFKKDMERRSSDDFNESKALSDGGSCAWIDDRVLNRRHSLQHSIDFDHLFDDTSLASSKHAQVTSSNGHSSGGSTPPRPQMHRQLSTREAAAAVAAEFAFDDEDEIVSVG